MHLAVGSNLYTASQLHSFTGRKERLGSQTPSGKSTEDCSVCFPSVQTHFDCAPIAANHLQGNWPGIADFYRRVFKAG